MPTQTSRRQAPALQRPRSAPATPAGSRRARSAAATEVSWALGTQVAKWAASATPASTQNRPSRRPAPTVSARELRPPAGQRARAEHGRPRARCARTRSASAGAAAKAISGAEDETASDRDREGADASSGSRVGRCGSDDTESQSSHATLGQPLTRQRCRYDHARPRRRSLDAAEALPMPRYRAVVFDFFGTLTRSVQRARPTDRPPSCSAADATRLVAVLDRTFYQPRQRAGSAPPRRRCAGSAEQAGGHPRTDAVRAAVARPASGAYAPTPGCAPTRCRRSPRCASGGVRTGADQRLHPRAAGVPAPAAGRARCSTPGSSRSRSGAASRTRRSTWPPAGGSTVRPQDCLYVGDGGSQELTGAGRAGMTAVRLAAPDLAEHLVFDAERGWAGPGAALADRGARRWSTATRRWCRRAPGCDTTPARGTRRPCRPTGSRVAIEKAAIVWICRRPRARRAVWCRGDGAPAVVSRSARAAAAQRSPGAGPGA